MFLSPDSTAILVSDRRHAREAAATARRRRSLLTTIRHARPGTSKPARMPASTGRTPVEVPARAA